MKVYIVKIDLGHPEADAAYWTIQKVFQSESAARAFAALDINREVEVHDVVPENDSETGGH